MINKNETLYLPEWDNCLKNGKLLWLKETGNKEEMDSYKEYYVAKNKTKGFLTVYNTETDSVSTKAIYINHAGRYYVKAHIKNYSSKLWYFLDEFKQIL